MACVVQDGTRKGHHGAIEQRRIWYGVPVNRVKSIGTGILVGDRSVGRGPDRAGRAAVVGVPPARGRWARSTGQQTTAGTC